MICCILISFTRITETRSVDYNETLAVYILKTHYLSRRTWANISCSSGLVSSVKNGTRCIIRLDQPCFTVRRSSRQQQIIFQDEKRE